MKIELIDPIPYLIAPYRNVIRRVINEKKITLGKWNSKYKFYRDKCGYSIINYFEAYFAKVESFVTTNPIMIENRKELEKIFGVKILNVLEAIDEKSD